MSYARFLLLASSLAAVAIPPPGPSGLYTFDKTLLQLADQTRYSNIENKVGATAFKGYMGEAINTTVTVTSVAALQAQLRSATTLRPNVWTKIVCETGGDWSADLSLYSSGGDIPVTFGSTGGIWVTKGATDPNIDGRWNLSGCSRLHVDGLRFTASRSVSEGALYDATQQIVIAVTGSNGGLSPENAYYTSTFAFTNNRFGLAFDPAKAALGSNRAIRALVVGTVLSGWITDNDFYTCVRGVLADRPYQMMLRNNRYRDIGLNPFSLSSTGTLDGTRTKTGIHPEDACYFDVDNNVILPPPDNLDGTVQADAPHIDTDQFILYDGGTASNPDPNHYSNHVPAVAHCHVLFRCNFVLCDNESFYLVGGSKKGAIINGHISSDYSGGSPHTFVMVGNIGATNGFFLQEGGNGIIVVAYNTWGAAPATRPGPADGNTNAFGKGLNFGTVRPGFSPTFRAYANISHGIGTSGDGALVSGLPANIDINNAPGTPVGSRPQAYLTGSWENTSHDSGFWQNKLNWQGLTIAQQKALLVAGWSPKTGVDAGAKLIPPS